MGDWPKPTPEDGEVPVRLHTAGVNPLEWKVRDDWVGDHFPHPPPFILGADVAGVVEAVGAAVTRCRVGDQVFGHFGLLGGYAEYAVAASNRIAIKPAALSLEEAAAVPISGMTALQGLFEEGRSRPGSAC